ncbi:luciferase family oxidoreductase, group 1 [Pseudonocardia thermophila]|uniref:Luciferase family oxidoreductase, group 1 n=1 Tax=Pseudonocardia thermophila TaxID=1848 RepID=A0A1M6QZ13_PSETH|nr:LLM class flavin-dependent oxidoreductase [Pseudonocardia thermophila]SHK25396.1 luciferase family oxidoreductase, group 1 [Pseudonocardia thermophila]
MSLPLSVLDLTPIPSGSDVRAAVRNTVDLARRAEEFGYRRYWLAEHHLNPGVAGAVPELMIQAVAAATQRIRVGSGAVQTGHRTPLSVVEAFGTLDALFPGRIDLGLGRSGGGPRSRTRPPEREPYVVDGVLIPRPFPVERFLRSPRIAATLQLLQQPGAKPLPYEEFVGTVFALLEGTWRSADGVAAGAVPGEGAVVETWILGSSGGESARLAGRLGLPFAANYHVSPATVLQAVEAYRAAFRPSARLTRPYVVVSADVVVGPDDDAARELATGYAAWVRSIRSGEGAIPFPSPREAAAFEWSDEDRELVADRIETQFVGSPRTVAAKLSALATVTGADELLITTITHGHADRVRSYALLAEEWARVPAAGG